MKSIRVTITAVVVAVFLLGFFFLPLPVTRVRQPGLVQIQPEYMEPVYPRVQGTLMRVYVTEGESVRKGKILADFYSLDLENKYHRAKDNVDLNLKLVKNFESHMEKLSGQQREGMLKALTTAFSDLRSARSQIEQLEQQRIWLTVKAPRDGVVMGLPPVDEVGKAWDKDQPAPFCSIGDPTKLRVLVPLSTSDYDLVRANIEKLKGGETLPVTIRVQGRGGATWTGKVTSMPKQEAKEVPPALSSKGGGPLAVKPSNDPHKMIPQAQVYLVGIDFDHPDDAIAPGALAQVKIHCEYRSAAWWSWRTISAMFDLGLSF